ncbi:MAG: hypothetical protein MPJ50_08100 [Pirellulales bacterium]|nr:hypothetical protein [Pirellulales bacterium]
MKLSVATLTMMLVFVLVAIGGGLALREYLKEEEVVAPPAPRIFAVALTDLQAGRVLTQNDIGLLPEPGLKQELVRQAETDAEGNLTSPHLRRRLDLEGNPVEVNGEAQYDLNLPMDVIANPGDLIGRRVKENVAKGTPYQASMFYAEGYRPALTTEVNDGRGVFTVPITNFIPGDQDVTNLRADVLFRNRAQEQPGFEPIPEQTVVLVQDARILEAGEPYVPVSAGTSTESGGSGGSADRVWTDVTLAVSRDAGAKLMSAQPNGDLMLMLYAPDSAGTEITTDDGRPASVKVTDFLEATPTPAPEVEIEPYDTIMFRGTNGFSNNSFSFDDLLRELAEVGAIDINLQPKDDDLAAHPARLTVPLNQPSNTGQRSSVAAGGNAAGDVALGGGDSGVAGSGPPDAGGGAAGNAGGRGGG